MKITSVYSVECCGKSHNFPYMYEAVKFLMGHIRQKHKHLLKRLEKHGRIMARSQQGMGYGGDWDWKNTQPTFREAWRKKALEQILREKEASACQRRIEQSKT